MDRYEVTFVNSSRSFLFKCGNLSPKKSKNESDQEETTDAWGFEKPSTSGISQIPRKVKTISWKQGMGGIRNSIHDGELENL
jgi:hypothetical protein